MYIHFNDDSIEGRPKAHISISAETESDGIQSKQEWEQQQEQQVEERHIT